MTKGIAALLAVTALLVLVYFVFSMSKLFDREGREVDPEDGLPWQGDPSIYAHIRAHIDAETGRLTAEGLELPDETKRSSTGDLRWVAGGLDGAFGHHTEGGESEEKATEIAELLARISRKGKLEDRIRLYRMLEDDAVIDFIDRTLEKAIDLGIAAEPHLHRFARALATESSDRGPVKFGVSLLGLVRDPANKEAISLLGKHEEFTLYSAVALTNLELDSEAALFELAQCVDGWGRIHTVERLAGTPSPEIKDWLLREGYRNTVMYGYLAYTCAKAGGLLDALEADRIDRQLFDATADILQALIEGGPAESIDDYDDAAEVVSRYLGHCQTFPKDLQHFLTLHQIREYLGLGDWSENERIENGWSAELRAELEAKLETLLSGAEWRALAMEGLSSEDEAEFFQADRAAQILEIDTSAIHWKRLKASPSDPGRWFQVMRKATPANIDQILELADKEIPYERIATGPTKELGLGPEFEWHACLDFILQDLHRFPGKGQDVVLAGLGSPSLRNRNMALNALDSWKEEDRAVGEVQSALARALKREPDDGVRKRIQMVMDGKVLE